MNPGIQVIVDHYVASVKSVNLTDGQILDLKNDVLHETRAERVEHSLAGKEFSITAFVGGTAYTSKVELDQMPLRSEFVAVPASVNHVTHGVSDEAKEEVAVKHEEEQNAQREEMNAKREEAAQQDAPHE